MSETENESNCSYFDVRRKKIAAKITEHKKK